MSPHEGPHSSNKETVPSTGYVHQDPECLAWLTSVEGVSFNCCVGPWTVSQQRPRHHSNTTTAP